MPLDDAQEPDPGYVGRAQVVGYFRASHRHACIEPLYSAFAVVAGPPACTMLCWP